MLITFLFRNFFFAALLFVVTFSGKTQIPQGYYDGIVGLEGEELRFALHQIIRGHNKRTYNQLWQDFYHTDRKPNGNVWCIYTDIPHPGEPVFEFVFFDDQQGTGGAAEEGLVYNREHSFPTSWWGGGSSSTDTMYTDLFHIHPVDAWINTLRSNWPYGEVCEPNHTTSNGSKRGTNCYDFEGAYSGTAFEPIDAYKGDLARNYFYMLTRYMHRIELWNDFNNTDMLEGSGFAPWAYDMLLKWHIMDPVSTKEINRNNAIYELQGNRNPFIDYPELVCHIWGGDCNFAPSIIYTNVVPQNPEAFDDVNIEVYIDDDGEVIEALLKWGLSPDDLDNIIVLESFGENMFLTKDAIPPQENLAVVYYQIIATDNDDNTTSSSVFEYIVGKPIGGGLETFDNSDASQNSYSNGYFIGNDDIKWNYYHARDQLTYDIDGIGMMFRAPNESRIVSEIVPNGIQDFSVKMRKAFTSDIPRQIELYINENKIAESQIFGAFDGECDSIHVFEVFDLNLEGNIIIELLLINPMGEEHNQLVIDDVFWTEYAPRITIQKDKMGCFPHTPIDEYSNAEEYHIIGKFLQDMIIIESEAPFEISRDNENFSYFTFFETTEEFEMHKLFVRFKPTGNVFYEGEIIHYSDDISNILEVCGYGGNVAVFSPDNNNDSQPSVYYKNHQINVVWNNIPKHNYTIDVYNINGKLLHKHIGSQEKHHAFSLRHPAGLIIVVINKDNTVFVNKVVVY